VKIISTLLATELRNKKKPMKGISDGAFRMQYKTFARKEELSLEDGFCGSSSYQYPFIPGDALATILNAR